jgi:hypothetical protein
VKEEERLDVTDGRQYTIHSEEEKKWTMLPGLPPGLYWYAISAWWTQELSEVVIMSVNLLILVLNRANLM